MKNITKVKLTTNLNGTRKEREYPSNSAVVKRHEMRSRGRVIWSGGTKIGSFESK